MLDYETMTEEQYEAYFYAMNGHEDDYMMDTDNEDN